MYFNIIYILYIPHHLQISQQFLQNTPFAQVLTSFTMIFNRTKAHKSAIT